MADLNRLNKLNSGGYKFKNQYTHKEEPKASKPPATPPQPKEKGVLELQGYEMGRMRILQDEVNALKMDIVTLLQAMEGEFPQMSVQAVRARYVNFRADPNHVANRIINKYEAINKGEL